MKYLVMAISEEPQDGRDLYSERDLECAGCGTRNGAAVVWALPGLCRDCALNVQSVSAAAPRVEARQMRMEGFGPVRRFA